MHIGNISLRPGVKHALEPASIRKTFHHTKFRARIWLSRRRYTRLPDETRVRIKPLSIFREVLRYAGKGLRVLFYQAKYLVPIEAEAIEVWMV